MADDGVEVYLKLGRTSRTIKQVFSNATSICDTYIALFSGLEDINSNYGPEVSFSSSCVAREYRRWFQTQFRFFCVM